MPGMFDWSLLLGGIVIASSVLAVVMALAYIMDLDK